MFKAYIFIFFSIIKENILYGILLELSQIDFLFINILHYSKFINFG